MILTVHFPGAPSYDVGDEIWQQPLEQAIADAAQTIAEHAGSDLLESPEPEHREQLRLQAIAEMTRALAGVGASYRAPDGVLYSLIDEGAEEHESDTVAAVRSSAPATVQQVVRLEELPLGAPGSRRAIVRWSDGSQGPALTWYADEVHVMEGDLFRQDCGAAAQPALPQGPRLAAVVRWGAEWAVRCSGRRRASGPDRSWRPGGRFGGGVRSSREHELWGWLTDGDRELSRHRNAAQQLRATSVKSRALVAANG